MNMKFLPEIIDEKAEYGECEKGCLIEFKTKVNWMYYYEVQSEQTERNDLEFFCRRISQSKKFINWMYYKWELEHLPKSKEISIWMYNEHENDNKFETLIKNNWKQT